ncbi:hypothetical protein [Clostridium sp. HBUAS56017]|uniref:hypothetical protein n=1 Tax=Clostridium sp. HBUAS56017 TaxID=2571128 RepID=UPI001177D41A|nr:hypothetical protein [Clostridium sp. HBUAS56017]
MIIIDDLLDRNYSISTLPIYWRKVVYAAAKKTECTERSMDDYLKIVEAFVQEYQSRDCIRSKILTEMLDLPDIVIILFYVSMYNKLKLENRELFHIAKMRKNIKWMMESDFCFVNIRALGKDVAETGNIIDAVKVIPSLRVNGIHLAPFFECSHGIVYCQDSFYRINEEIVNLYYLRENVEPIEQMKFLIDCIHILNKSVGFDVTPHTSWNSKLRLDRPELFRWVRLNKSKNDLYDNMTIDSQYEDKCQKVFKEDISKIVNEIKDKYSVKRLDEVDSNLELCKEATQKINKELQNEGYFTVPPHTWNGVGVPDFKKYAENIHMPIWSYLDINGDDQGQHAIWLHSSLYIHKGMYGNQLPAQISGDTKKDEVQRNEEVILFFNQYLTEVVERYNFDFIRMDYIDHIFDNIIKVKGEEIPLSEMFTPAEIKEVITNLRKEYPGLGLQADHLGYDAKIFETVGFNLITGSEVGLSIDRWHLNEIFENLIKQEKIQGDICRATFAIDTHDMAHPLFLGKEIAHREGKIGIIARLFISRFGNVGLYRRPKYEVIGNQDLSYGIHSANNKAESLVWGSNKVVYNAYHDIEDIYADLKEVLKESSMTEYYISNKHVGWQIYNKKKRKRFIAVIPVVLQDGIPCDSDLIRKQKDKGEKDRIEFEFDFPKGGGMEDVLKMDHENIKRNYNFDCKVCTSVEELKFNRVKTINCDKLFSLYVRNNRLVVEMKTYGFVLLEALNI